MAKLKIRNQSIRTVDSDVTYADYLRNKETSEGDGAKETYHANPDMLTEAAGYWAVDEATKEVQVKVRLMLEKAKQVLTQQQYNAFVLVDLKKLKLRDAAKVMEVNHARVDQLIKRARLKLQAVYHGLE
jgi:DNA-directed RNA polymerase specialized sigma24 family protein